MTPATVRSNTSALKDQLKEKEQHIEQLLKERDLERAEVAKAASQTDEAEAKLVQLKQEFDAFKQQQGGESSNVKELLDEERKKNEDLQFRLEELEILSSEGDKGSAEVEEDMKNLRAKIISLEEKSLSVTCEKEELEKKLEKMEKQSASMQDVLKEKRDLQDKMSILSKELAQEQKRCENFEAEANKYFEIEEQLMEKKEELVLIQKKFQESEKLLEKEKIIKEEMISNQKTEGQSQSEKLFDMKLHSLLSARNNKLTSVSTHNGYTVCAQIHGPQTFGLAEMIE